MRFFWRIFIGVFLIVILAVTIVQADEYDDITRQLGELNKALNSSKSATQTNEKQHESLKKQIENIRYKVKQLSDEIDKKEKEVAEGEEALTYQKELLDERTVSHYKNIGNDSFSLIDLLIAENLSHFLQNLHYQESLLNEDQKTIVKIVLYIKELEEKKLKLESEKKKLSSIKEEVDRQSQFLAKEIEKSKAYEGELQKKIASITARQQQILAQKLANLKISRSAGSAMGGCSDDRTVDPGFSPRYAFFTYGVPNRVGMNQWGAYGRSKAGQDYKTILNAYYNNVRFECRSFPGNNIKVKGYGDVNIKNYLKGLGEMFSGWGDTGGFEAFKAQVVAAASYAFAYTNGGSGEICTSESCQVYLGHNKGGAWDRSVDETGSCGDGVEVMVSNDTNEVISAWYSSTFGGYSRTSGEIWGGNKPWTKRMRDTNGDISSFSDLQSKSFDRESPWFYCDWGSRAQYNKTAWLKPEEVADIANILLLAKSDPSVQDHLSQPDKPNPDGAETWDAERVKSELRSRGGTPLSSVSSVSINWDQGSGTTGSVVISGDGGSYTFDGGEFKNFFNLRAPANIQIVGQLYNVEKQ